MSIPRLFVEADLSEGAEVSAGEAAARHLGGALRRGPGDPVRLFNGRDGEWRGRVLRLRRGEAALLAEARLRAQVPASGPVLWLSLLKREAMGWAVEKATELGARTVRPVAAARSVPGQAREDRLALVARGAAEQCERLDVPEVAGAVPLGAVPGGAAGSPLVVLAERRGAPPLPAVLAGLPAGMPALLVGPEGGFEAGELDALARRPFVALASLGPRILRAETAAVSALAILQALRGDLGPP